MGFVPSLANGGDHLVNHGGTVGSLGNAGRGTGGIGTGKASDAEYVEASTRCVKDVNPEIAVLQGAGIKCYDDVYRNIFAGADATGSSSGIVALPTREARAQMIDDMIRAVREAYDARQK